MSARKGPGRPKVQTPVQVAASAERLWLTAQDELAPAAIRKVEAAVDKLLVQVGGRPTAEFVAGMVLGSSLVGELAKASPLGAAMATLTGVAQDSMPYLVAGCLAHRILSGEIEPPAAP